MDDPEQLIDHDTAKQLIEKDLQKFLSDQNGDLPYVQSKHEERTNLIIENVLKIMAQFNDDLVAANPEEPKIFKFVVHCVLQQKTGAWVQSATCQYWDRSTDSHLTVIHETEHMQCIVTIYMVST